MDILCSNFLSNQFAIFITLEDLFNLDAALKYSLMKDIILRNLNKKIWNLDLLFGIMPNLVEIEWIVRKNFNIKGVSFSGIEIKSNIQQILPRIFSLGNGNGLLKLTLSNCNFEQHDYYSRSPDFYLNLRKILRYNKNLNYIDLSSTELNDKGLAAISKHCKNLRILHMRNCSHITDNGIRCVLKSLERLLDLDISFCKKITDNGFDHEEINMDFLKLKYITLQNVVGISCAVNVIAKKCPNLVYFDCSGTSLGYKEDVPALLIIQRCLFLEEIVFQDYTNLKFDARVKNDPTIKFIRSVSYDDLEYNDHRYRKKGFRKYLIDKIKVEIEYEKKEKYNFLEDKIEWVSDPDDGWILTQYKLQIALEISRRKLDEEIQHERKKIIEKNRMLDFELLLKIADEIQDEVVVVNEEITMELEEDFESSQMDFEWLIKLAEEIQDEVMLVKEETTIE